MLISISTGDAAAKRRLRLELAGAESPDEVAKEVRKQLTVIGQSRAFVNWQNRRVLMEDMETQRRAIVGQVAEADTVEALLLMWRISPSSGSRFGAEICIAARPAGHCAAALASSTYGQMKCGKSDLKYSVIDEEFYESSGKAYFLIASFILLIFRIALLTGSRY